LIPVNKPWLDIRERELLLKAMDSGWISGSGEFIQRFEDKWAKVCGRTYGIAVSNGTAALETAVWALGLPEGSEVIMPTFTIISCALALLRNNLIPVFVDADPRNWCMDVNQVAERITTRTSAIMVVHTYGHPVNLQSICELAEKHNIRIIEDASEAHGARFRGKICGGFGVASCFSFYANKIVTTGEGGMVLCDNAEIAERCRAYRNLGFGRDNRFLHTRLGQNFRLTNLQAAIGCAQIDKLPQALDRKVRIAKTYNELLKGIPDLNLPVQEEWALNVYWVYGIVLGESYSFDALECQRRLRKYGVDTRRFFLGMHEQPVIRDKGFGIGERYPVAERLSRYGIYLPSGIGTTLEDIRRSAEAVRKCLAS